MGDVETEQNAVTGQEGGKKKIEEPASAGDASTAPILWRLFLLTLRVTIFIDETHERKEGDLCPLKAQARKSGKTNLMVASKRSKKQKKCFKMAISSARM